MWVLYRSTPETISNAQALHLCKRNITKSSLNNYKKNKKKGNNREIKIAYLVMEIKLQNT